MNFQVPINKVRRNVVYQFVGVVERLVAMAWDVIAYSVLSVSMFNYSFNTIFSTGPLFKWIGVLSLLVVDLLPVTYLFASSSVRGVPEYG